MKRLTLVMNIIILTGLVYSMFYTQHLYTISKEINILDSTILGAVLGISIGNISYKIYDSLKLK